MNTLKMVHAPWWYCYHWAGRTASVLLLAAWLLFVLAEGIPDPAGLGWGVIAQSIALLAMFAGYALGWKKALAGGVVGLAALAAFYAINMLDVGQLPRGAFPLFALPSVLYLIAYGLYRRGH
jgi:hypothetical protein